MSMFEVMSDWLKPCCFKFGNDCDACNRLDEGSAQQALKSELMACLGGKG